VSKPSLTQVEARKLAGRRWVIDGEAYRFANYDPSEPGQPPWKSGAEGLAYPLRGQQGNVAAYVKSFDEMKAGDTRVRRTEWLISQRLHEVTPELRAAPCHWLDTSIVGRPDQIGFDFACSFSTAVPGQTWLETRGDVADAVLQLESEFRERCVRNLLNALAHLERCDVVHGDLSPNNVIVNVNASLDEPALWLIDFDGFASPGAGAELNQLTIGEGGTVGTKGYCPPELYERHAAGDRSVAPFSDRFGRDMLLLEFLCFDAQCDYEAPVCDWSRDQIQSRLQQSSIAQLLPHLSNPNVWRLDEAQRPSSEQLAQAMQCSSSPVGLVARSGSLIAQLSKPTLSIPWTSICGRVAFRVLWLTCVTVLALLCFTSTRLAAQGLGREAGVLSFVAQLLCSVGLFASIATPLTVQAFACAQPTAVNVLGLWFRIPPRKNLWWTDLRHRIRMAGVLAGLLALMTPCLLLVLW
jgi:hypothetical protein